MPLPSFTFTGSVFDILGNVAANELVENGFGAGGQASAKITFTPNVPINQFVTWNGHAERIKPVVATINSAGQIKRNGDTVRLLANDPDLSVSGVQYRVDVQGMKPFVFDAPNDGDSKDFSTVVPVAYVAATPITAGNPVFAVKVDDGPPALYQWQTEAGELVGDPQEIDVVLPDVEAIVDAAVAGKVDKSTVTTKGDLIAATGSSTVSRLPAGSDGSVLKANSAQATGLQWVGETRINGADSRFGTPGTRAAFIAALNAAEAIGKHVIVNIPSGLIIDVGNGLALSGYSTQIVCDGGGMSSGGAGEGAVIKASTQTGPVLDFTGYVTPSQFKGKITPLANVVIEGSNVADATKVKSGLKFTSMSSAYFHDIAIHKTGGPCVEMAESAGNAFYLSDMERVVLFTPVSAKANDVPYFYANECNGNRFRGIGLRSTSSSADVGASGAVVIEGNASVSPENNLFDAWWFENLHPPTNGTLFHHAGNMDTIRDFQFFDCQMESGATGTSFYRLAAPAVNDYGGNTLAGVIPGDNGTSVDISTGVDVRQSRNNIVGPRAFQDKNVTLASGVGYTYVHLTGAAGATPGGTPFIDNSGTDTNVLIDDVSGTEMLKTNQNASVLRARVIGNATPRWNLLTQGYMEWSDGTNPPDVAMSRNTAGGLYIDAKLFTNSVAPVAASGVQPVIIAGAGSPEGVKAAPIGSLYLRNDGGANTCLYVKESGTGNTGWVAK